MNPATDTAGALRTPLCALLGIHYPLIQAPMAGAGRPPRWSPRCRPPGGWG